MGSIKIDGSYLETPFTVRQVDTHLVFGPISRHIPCAYLVIFGIVASFFIGSFHSGQSLGRFILGILGRLFFLPVPLLLLQMTRRQQAIAGWLAVKISLGIGAILMAAVGSTLSFEHGYADAWSNLALGLLWIPSVEFIARITPYQRYVTIGRIILSIPCIYWGTKSGNWCWT